MLATPAHLLLTHTVHSALMATVQRGTPPPTHCPRPQFLHQCRVAQLKNNLLHYHEELHNGKTQAPHRNQFIFVYLALLCHVPVLNAITVSFHLSRNQNGFLDSKKMNIRLDTVSPSSVCIIAAVPHASKTPHTLHTHMLHSSHQCSPTPGG